jgi:SAM-dependent methyltransferase
MIGVDFSRAIDAAHQNTKQFARVHLIQCDIYRLPLKPGVFDFAYSVGVLHHLPNPEGGFQQLPRLVKPYAPVLIWVYSSQRLMLNRLLEGVRGVTRRLHHRVLYVLCWLAAAVEWSVFIRPCRWFPEFRHGFSEHQEIRPQPLAQRLFPARVHLYCQHPFQVSHADWFDRLSAPLRHYYNSQEVSVWFERAGLTNILVTPTGLYGWRGYGERGPGGTRLNDAGVASGIAR